MQESALLYILVYLHNRIDGDPMGMKSWQLESRSRARSIKRSSGFCGKRLISYARWSNGHDCLGMRLMPDHHFAIGVCVCVCHYACVCVLPQNCCKLDYILKSKQATSQKLGNLVLRQKVVLYKTGKFLQTSVA